MSTKLPTFTIPDRLRIGTATPASAETRRLLLFAILLTFVLNFVPGSQYVLYPLRLFTTFVHESGHAFATLLVGGGVHSLSVAPDGSGLTESMGASFPTAWLIDSAGYLGTILFGALLLQIGRVTQVQNAGRVMLSALAVAMLGIMIWVRDPFTLVAGLSIAGIFWFLSRKTSPRVAEFLAMFLAAYCSLNALFDIKTLLFLSTQMPGTHTDALNMQHMYLLPAAFWAFLWAIIAVGILGLSLWSYLRPASKRSF
jgi:Peptidase M50B-like